MKLVLAVLAARVGAFYSSLLDCCEAKCHASGAETYSMQACKLSGCMSRWNGDSMDRCMQHCNKAVAGQEEQRMCVVGCNNYNDCNCPRAKYFSQPDDWAFKRQDATCRLCPPGYECKGETHGPVRCPAGKYSAGALSSCESCPAGLYGLGGSSTAACSGSCPAGRYGAKGSTTSACTGACSQQPGRYAVAAAVDQKSCAAKCPAGYFSNLGANPACDGPCPVGKYSLKGSQACSNCPAGTFGAISALSSPICSGVCARGTYSRPGSVHCSSLFHAPATATAAAAAAEPRQPQQPATAASGAFAEAHKKISGPTAPLPWSWSVKKHAAEGKLFVPQASTTFGGRFTPSPRAAHPPPAGGVARGVPPPTRISRSTSSGSTDSSAGSASYGGSGACKNGGKTVPDQWIGPGSGADWCNQCLCSSGKMVCTTNHCGRTPTAPPVQVPTKPPSLAPTPKHKFDPLNECLNDEKIVADGWMGMGLKDSSNWCNVCYCDSSKDSFVRCSAKTCGAHPTPAPTPVLDWQTMCKHGEGYVPDGWNGKGLGAQWCNHCACSKTAMSCTTMQCGPNPKSCLYDPRLKTYKREGWTGLGEKHGLDWCNLCTCSEGQLVCTPKSCGINPSVPTTAPTPDPTRCKYGKSTVRDGWVGQGHGMQFCNTCTCEDGVLFCTQDHCNPACRWVKCALQRDGVAPTCRGRGLVAKKRKDWENCCFNALTDCALPAIKSAGSGHYWGKAPYLDGGGVHNIQTSQADCEAQCKSLDRCKVGTYVNAEHTHAAEKVCDKPCVSFMKVASVAGEDGSSSNSDSTSSNGGGASGQGGGGFHADADANRVDLSPLCSCVEGTTVEDLAECGRGSSESDAAAAAAAPATIIQTAQTAPAPAAAPVPAVPSGRKRRAVDRGHGIGLTFGHFHVGSRRQRRLLGSEEREQWGSSYVSTGGAAAAVSSRRLYAFESASKSAPAIHRPTLSYLAKLKQHLVAVLGKLESRRKTSPTPPIAAHHRNAPPSAWSSPKTTTAAPTVGGARPYAPPAAWNIPARTPPSPLPAAPSASNSAAAAAGAAGIVMRGRHCATRMQGGKSTCQCW